jgi:hypothetical protein
MVLLLIPSLFHFHYTPGHNSTSAVIHEMNRSRVRFHAKARKIKRRRGVIERKQRRG